MHPTTRAFPSFSSSVPALPECFKLRFQQFGITLRGHRHAWSLLGPAIKLSLHPLASLDFSRNASRARFVSGTELLSRTTEQKLISKCCDEKPHAIVSVTYIVDCMSCNKFCFLLLRPRIGSSLSGQKPMHLFRFCRLLGRSLLQGAHPQFH